MEYYTKQVIQKLNGTQPFMTFFWLCAKSYYIHEPYVSCRSLLRVLAQTSLVVFSFYILRKDLYFTTIVLPAFAYISIHQFIRSG